MSKLYAFCAVLLMLSPCVAQADEELMNPWPKQRADHQSTIDSKAAEYQSRGYDYVNHQYATGGEEEMPAPEGFMDAPMMENDTVPVNVDEVAKIIKSSTPSR